jgi:hypothetical protein
MWLEREAGCSHPSSVKTENVHHVLSVPHTYSLHINNWSVVSVVTCVERRRRWSDTYRGVPDSDEEDEVDGKERKDGVEKMEDKKLKVIQVCL